VAGVEVGEQARSPPARAGEAGAAGSARPPGMMRRRAKVPGYGAVTVGGAAGLKAQAVSLPRSEGWTGEVTW
jgi:hypothetical protein